MPKQRRKRKLYIFLSILAWFATVFLFLFYSPFAQFRVLWINTAMYSSRHQFLATALYSKSYIAKVLDIPFPEEQTNAEPLREAFDNSVLFAEIKGDYFRGYLIRIEDPRRLALVPVVNEEGELLEDLIAAHQGFGGVNGGGYRDEKRRGLPWGTVIADGALVSVCAEHRLHTIGGLTRSHKLVVGRMSDQEILERDFEWAFEFGPMLIVNGAKTVLNSLSGGLAPRTAIGQTKAGHILLLVIDGRKPSSIGATFQDVQMVLYANDAMNAISLDGGASSCMVYNGALVNNPSEGNSGRLLPNAILFR
ncbi:MAG: phosphodiester glycosidase family protein [Treponema sp.]|jgi:exopolysaccharide biosynthesis protein|nr:phosphodiester glycosidase family protein [Treponema sp.]